MKKRMNRKAAEMTIGTLVVIILAVIVLVILVYGFSVGWGNFFNNLVGFGGGQVNAQTVVQSCQIACSTQAKYDYCERRRNVVFDTNKNNKHNNLQYTCFQLASDPAFNAGYNLGLEPCNLDCIENQPTPTP
jgi:hypothetical protein